MSQPPLPPLVDGPITTASSSVPVDNLLPNSKVTVYSNGSQVGSATSVNGGWILVPVTTPLQAGKQITAKQQYTGGNSSIAGTGESDASNAVPVLTLPSPMPAPAFASGVTTCGGQVYLSNLIPGARVTVKQGGNTVVHDVEVALTTQAFTLSANLTSGSSLSATQSAGGITSANAQSLAVEQAPEPLPAPVVAEPLYVCQTAIDLSNLTPTAKCVVAYGTWTDTFTSAWSEFELDDMPPLTEGTLSVRQSYARCDKPASPTATFNVTRQSLPFPLVSYRPCGDVRQLVVSKLIPGSILTLSRVVTSASGTTTKKIVGTQGVAHKTVTVNLPTSFSASDPDGTVSLEIAVALCSQTPPAPGYTTVHFATPGSSAGEPALRTPLEACSAFVIVTGVVPGSEIQVFSGSTAHPRSAPVVATGPEVQVDLWTPLVVNESIFAAQTGCHASGQSQHVMVVNGKPVEPVIQTPVRPGDATVGASNLLPGAHVYLIVNGSARTQTMALGTTAALGVGSPALANGDQLEVVQSICTLTSAPGKATVQLGVLKVSATPNSLVEAEAAEFLVITTDEQKGAVINGLPVQAAESFNGIGAPQGPSSSGFTGTSFSYTPGPNDTTASLWVTGGPGYENTYYSPIPVTAPPPETPIDLSPSGNVVQPVRLSWVDPGAGTSREAEYFSLAFSQNGHLCEPTPVAAIIVAGNVTGDVRSYVASGIAGGQVLWSVEASIGNQNSGVATANINVLTGPVISVARSSGNTFEVTGSNFSGGGSVSLDVQTALAGGKSDAIQRTLTADSAGGWSTSVNCSEMCSSAGGGGLTFVATDENTNSSSNPATPNCT